MKTGKIFRGAFILTTALIIQVTGAEQIEFGDIAQPSIQSHSSQNENNPFDNTSLFEPSVEGQSEFSSDTQTITKQLKQLVNMQKNFFKKYESGILSSNQEIARFKIDLAILEFNTNAALHRVDAYLASEEYGNQDLSEAYAFDTILEVEEKQRTKIETLISEMKYNQDQKFYIHQLKYTIRVGN